MLTPTIGIVQAGWQAMADRYMYLPLIGLAIIAAWTTRETARRMPTATFAVVGIALAGMATISIIQQGYWQDTRTLFEHALAVTDNNAFAHVQLGYLETSKGNLAAARRHYELALSIPFNDADNADAQYNLGNLLLKDDPNSAIEHYRLAIAAGLYSARAENNWGIALARLGKTVDASKHFLRAIEIDPEFAEPHANLGLLWLAAGNSSAAAEEFQAALRLNANLPSARLGLMRLMQSKAAGGGR
jgi:Tfp pilus assembly protein PilF